MNTYGFPADQWTSARDEAKRAMIEAARKEATISYSELVEQIKSIKFAPHDFNLFHLLGQGSTLEYEKGRGLLSAVVVRLEDGIPGEGFFELAKDLNLAVDDRDAFWVSQVRKVYQIWSSTKTSEEGSSG